MKKTVQVFMSTYNGEKYVKEQIDSILLQENVEVKLLIRDDGSRDSTKKILKAYEEKYENIEVYSGKNLGACKSFFDLMQHADKKVDYFAFADQDDVWNKNKLDRAVYLIGDEALDAVLYCGCYTLVNSRLKKLKYNNRLSNDVKDIFGNALIENRCMGGAAVFNRPLLELILNKVPMKAYMHDWWIYLVAAAFGKVIFDNTPFLYYRQHDYNVVGVNNTILGNLQKRINNFQKLRKYVPDQVKEFEMIYGNLLSCSQKYQITYLMNQKRNPLSRLKIFRIKGIKRSRFIEDIIYKTMYLFWRI